MKTRNTLLPLLTFCPFFLFCQVDSNSVEMFFQNRSCRIYYWQKSNYRIFNNTPPAEFMVLNIIVRRDSLAENIYEITESRIRLDRNESGSTYFYYVPVNKFNDAQYELYLPDQEKVSYKTNDAPPCKSDEELSEISKSINLFESDLMKYAELKKEDYNYSASIPGSLAASALLAYGAFNGYNHRNSPGSKGTWNLIGGIASGAISITFLITSAIHFFNYLDNNSELDDIVTRIERSEY